MARAIRMYGDDGMYFVTARTAQARMLLRPSTNTNEVLGGVLARAARRYQVKVYGFVFASNHLHLLVRARGGSLSRFMQYLQGNIARKIGKLVHWDGPFWQGRFHAEPVLDDGAAIRRLAYIIAHGVKEGLVRRVVDWPGLSCVKQLLGSPLRRFKWFDWARRWAKRKSGTPTAGLFDDGISECETLTLEVLPPWEHLKPDDRRKRVQELIAEVEKSARIQHPQVLGADAVRARDPHSRSLAPKKSPAPLCHASDEMVRKMFHEAYRLFVATYRLASALFLSGDLAAAFPPFSFRPPISALASAQ